MSVSPVKGNAFAVAFVGANATNVTNVVDANPSVTTNSSVPTADIPNTPNKKQKHENTMKVVFDLWQKEMEKMCQKDVALVRTFLSHPKAQGHVESSRKRILEGASHLTKDSIVVILGPQVVGKKNVPLEPIKELAERCKQVILVDFDAPTLALIRSKINCSNVTYQLVDLSDGAYKEVLRIGVDAFKQKPNKREDWYVEKFIEWLDSSQFHDRIPKLIDKILPNGEKADYVISSLVASEIGAIVDQVGLFTSNTVLKIESFDRKFMMPLTVAKDKNRERFVKMHLDLLFNLIKVKGVGRIYFADTTKILKDSRGVQAAESFTVYNSLNSLIDSLKCRKEKRSWNWENSFKTWQVDSWMLSSIPDDLSISFPRIKSLAPSAAGTTHSAKASVPSSVTTSVTGASTLPSSQLDDVD